MTITPGSLLVLSVFVQVGLTFILLFRLGPARVAVIKAGQVKMKDVALGQDAWPDHIRQLSRSYASQFELPVLFYACAGIALAMAYVDWVLAVAALAFAASRLVHAYVHVTSNYVPSRFRAFVAGVFILLAMWGWLGGRLLLQGFMP